MRWGRSKRGRKIPKDEYVLRIVSPCGGYRDRDRKKADGLPSATMPVTTVPIFLHLQPILAPLPIPEPPILLSAQSLSPSSPSTPPNHLYFVMTLQDPTHSLRFTTVSQPSPGDWLDVEYENSDWVEERLVEVLRTGVEIIAQDVSLIFEQQGSSG